MIPTPETAKMQLKTRLRPEQLNLLRRLHQSTWVAGWSAVHRAFLTPFNLYRNRNRSARRLEIGPGRERIPGFETLNVRAGGRLDYVVDAARKLPFPDATFEIIYASHVLEHVPWYMTDRVLREWVRVLRPGGVLEIWVPDALKIAEAFVAAERDGDRRFEEDGVFRYNEQRDPCRWMAFRTFSYGDGTGATDHPNWHRAAFSPRHLKACLETAGLTEIRRLDRSEVRGFDHGWINLGMAGRKPP